MVLSNYLLMNDVKLYLEIANSDDADKLQYALDLITDREADWQLRISISKCNVLMIGKPR